MENQESDKFVQDYRMLMIKAKVMEDESQETHVLIDSSADKVRTKQKSLSLLQKEKKDCIDRLKKV